MRSYLCVILLIAGCATKPTPYQKEKKKEGYRDSTQEELRVASFRANTKTKKSKARSYAEFRAIEYCQGQEKKHANIIDINDKTVEKQITRTSGSGWGPTYGFGMYPYYSRYSSFGIGATFNTISTDSWNETLTFPYVEVYYTCADRMYRPEIMLKEISPEEMKLLVKDLKGALQVEKIADQSSNKNAIEQGDLILKANGRRVEKVYELIRLFDSPDSEVTVQLLREGQKIVSKLKAKDVTDDVIAAEKEIIKQVCKDKKKDNQKVLKTRCAGI
jgi:hypothetical protein